MQIRGNPVERYPDDRFAEAFLYSRSREHWGLLTDHDDPPNLLKIGPYEPIYVWGTFVGRQLLRGDLPQNGWTRDDPESGPSPVIEPAVCLH